MATFVGLFVAFVVPWLGALAFFAWLARRRWRQWTGKEE